MWEVWYQLVALIMWSTGDIMYSVCVCMLHWPSICIVVWRVVMATGVCSTSSSLWGIVWTFSDCCHGNIDRLSSQVMGKKQRWNILLLWYVTFICFLWWDCTYHIITYYILHITYYILHICTHHYSQSLWQWIICCCSAIGAAISGRREVSGGHLVVAQHHHAGVSNACKQWIMWSFVGLVM